MTHSGLARRDGAEDESKHGGDSLLQMPTDRCLYRVCMSRAEVGEGDRPGTADEMLFSELYPWLRRLAAVIGPAEVDPDDLVQEAVARALAIGALSELANPRAYLSTALVRLAANQRRSFMRGRRAIQRVAEPQHAKSPAYPSDLDILNQLSPTERAVLYLTTVEGLSAASTAELLGSSPAAVRMRRSRALRRLRSWIKQQEDGDG